MTNIQSNLKIHILLGIGNAQRYVNVDKLYATLDPNLCASLPGFHASTGCDFNPAFIEEGENPLDLLRKFQTYIKVY